MFCFNKIVIITIAIISIINNSIANDIESPFKKRCDKNNSKEKAERYAKCDTYLSIFKSRLSKCCKEVCNKDGKYTKPDICCIVESPNIPDCYRREEMIEAKAQGITVNEYRNKTLPVLIKLTDCYSKIV